MGETPASNGSAAGSRLDWLRAAPATTAIAGLCAVGFFMTLGHCVSRGGDATALMETAWSMGACEGSLEATGALALGRVWVDGEWWRLSTTGFLHGSWLHIILNTWSLFVIGPWVERGWGSLRMAVMFALSSLVGCAASVAWAEAPVVVGASAGILGLAAGLFVGRRFGTPGLRQNLDPVSAKGLGWMLAALVALGFFVPVIAQAGHLGGLVGGAVLGLAWRSGRGRGGGWGVPAVAGLLAVLVQVGRAPSFRAEYFEFTGYRHLELGADGHAAAAFEVALERKPGDPQLANAVAYAYAKAGRELGRAEALVRGALEIEPDNQDFVDTLGWVLCQSGRVEEGRAALERASSLAEGGDEVIEEHLRTCAE